MGGFFHLLQKVKEGSSEDYEYLVMVYQRMLTKEAWVQGKYDEDLYQELLIALYNAAVYFN